MLALRADKSLRACTVVVLCSNRYALASVLAWRRLATAAGRHLAEITAKALGTLAPVRVDGVHALSGVLTRDIHTVVNVHLAVVAIEAGRTLTREVVDSVHALRLVLADGAEQSAFINVDPAPRPGETWCTRTVKCTHQVAALAPVHAHVAGQASTVVHVDLTVGAREACRAQTRVLVQSVDALCSIQAWLGLTLVNLHSAECSCEPSCAPVAILHAEHERHQSASTIVDKV